MKKIIDKLPKANKDFLVTPMVVISVVLFFSIIPALVVFSLIGGGGIFAIEIKKSENQYSSTAHKIVRSGASTLSNLTSLGVNKEHINGYAKGSSSHLCNDSSINLKSKKLKIDYLRIPVVANGSLRGGVMWSSDKNLPSSISPQRLIPKNSLAVRVYVKPAPWSCNIINTPPEHLRSQYNVQNFYGLLDVTVGIRNPNLGTSGHWEKITFSQVQVDQCSPVGHFVSIPKTSSPLIIELLDVKSDFMCLNGLSKFCPSAYIGWMACWEIELHIINED